MNEVTTKYLLLFDDDRLVHSTFDISLIGTSHKLLSIYTPHEAFKYAIEPNNFNYPKPNLIFMDLMFDNIFGTEVIRGLRKNNYFDDIPVFIYTAYNYDEEKYGKLSDLRVKGIISKPCARQTLIKCIDEINR